MTIMNRRQLLGAGLGLGAALALGACGRGSGDTGTLRVGALGKVSALQQDPHANLSNESDFLIASLVYDPLTVPGADPTVAPRLASSWSADPDQRRWVFTLAEGAKFHDGSPVTADDVVWSLRRLREVGGESKVPVRAEDITADGPGRVVLTAAAPNSQIPLLVRLMTFTVKQGSTDFTKPVGSGPFRLESYRQGNARLVRNDAWHGPKPRLEAIEITMFESVDALSNAVLGGQIDLASNVGAIAGRTAAGRGDLQVVRRPNDTVVAIAMRTADGPFADPRVRTALRLAADRDALVAQAFSGFGAVANDILGTGDTQYAKDIPQRRRDLDRARALLAEASFDTGATYQLVTKEEVPGEPESAKLFAAQAREIGVKLEVVVQDSGTFYDRTWLHAPLYTVNWGTNDSVLFFATKLMASTSNRNETAFDDPDFDATTGAALAASNPADYARSCRAVQQIQHERGGYLVWGVADGIDIAATRVKDLPTLGGFGRVQLERVWLAS
ncbi:ABC transporter substrate-binding protein [Nocardia transvalensis]|uniref:ABC transporter substrate-binding protein n=1 Tax=Nocardia transvalensis TaxID=37333 RepID=UPI0018936677|nr:ABC transporter substrate-binding protein [Nocardia transvalensis]MBF6330713.1 ABC transporter substrate-binding protein [Nocardia transvalensis]